MKLTDRPGITLYYRIKTIIQDAIKDGSLKPNQKIPNEIDIAQKYGVSRATVRQAILELTREGVVTRKRGVGTFVTPPKFDTSINLEFCYPDAYGDRHKTLKKEVIQPSKEIRTLYNLPSDAKVYALTRSRFFDNATVAIETIYFPLSIFPGIENSHIEGRAFDYVMEKYHIRLENFTTEIEPVILSCKDAEIFEVKRPAAGLILTRVCRDDMGRTLLWHHSLFRGDCCKFLFK